MKNPKVKGGKFEREVCRKLSLWVTDGKRKDVFWRSAMSGGRATIHGVEVRQCGDIAAVAPEGHEFASKWFVECKHVKRVRFNLDQYIFKGTGPLSKYLHKALRESHKHSRDMMLIVQQNGCPAVVITRQNHIAHWCAPRATIYRRLHKDKYTHDISYLEDLLKASYEATGRFRDRRKE